MDAAGAAGTGTQTGEAGAGGAPDAGTAPDASTDAGAPAVDAGPTEDAGDAGPEAGPATATLEVTLSGNGSVAVTDAAACLAGPCQYPLTDGSLLTLEAKPGPDSRFVGWSGACTGTTPITTVTVSGLKECIATFALQRAVSVSVDVPGNGTVSTDPNVGCTAQGCSGQVDDKSNLTLQATAATGYRFVSWTGSAACEGSALAALPLVITGDLACTAKFSKQYQVTVSAQGAAATVSVHNGACTALSCLADTGSTATFTAIDVPGFRFTGWTGSAQCTGTGSPLDLVVTSDIACVANYVARFKVTGLVALPQTGAVTATSADVNSTCSTNSCLVDTGKSTTLVAPTINGYRLTGWTGAGCPATGQGNGVTVTPTNADIVCTATYALGVSVTGTVVGATGTVAAASNSPGNNCVPGAGGCSIDANGSVTLTAPNLLPTYRFVNWTGDAGCAGAAATITLTNVASSKACNANYLQQFTIVAKANVGGTATAAVGGNLCANGSCTVDAGTGVALSAAPDTANGYHFTGWSGTNCAPPASNPLTLSNLNTTCSANFALNTFTIAATAGTNGTVTATRTDTNALCGGASCLVNFGTNVSLAATPALHYHFVGWTGASCPATGTPISLKNLSTTCNATFAIDTFSATAAITPTAAGTATISCTPNACTAVPYGTLVNISVAVNTGWSLVSWSPGCNAGGVTVTANTACVATYRPIVTGIGAPASAGSVVVTSPGTATCVAGNPATCAVDSGSAVTLQPKPAINSVFSTWSGGCTGTTSPYNLTNVTAPVTCTANYYQLWAQATGAAANDYMDNVVGLADGTVVGFGTSANGGARLSLVDLNANTGKVGRNQVFNDTQDPKTAQFAALGLAVTSNQKNIIALGAHRSALAGVPATQYPWLHNEQAPAWEYEYKYTQGTAATISGTVPVQFTGNVITTLDGGYAFCIGGGDKAVGNAAHLTKVDATGKPAWDFLFRGTDVNGGLIDVIPVDVLEDPAKKYFVVLAELETSPAQLLLAYVSEAGVLLSADQYADNAHDLKPVRFVAVAADTFMVAGSRVVTATGDTDGFYAQLVKGAPKSARAFDVGTRTAQETFNSITRTPTGFALVGQFADPTLGLEAWLVQLSAADAITAQFSYGGPQAKNQIDAAISVFAMPAGGLAVGGYTNSWGAGLADMWTLRLDANANITFNGASAAHRTATGYTATAVDTLASITPDLVTIANTVSQATPQVAVSAAAFTQNQQAP